MDYEEAVSALRARGRGPMVPDLSRIRRLAELLGDPQLGYPTVHVTGTNGKTSISRITTTLLSAVGLAAGTYTSPHLQVVRERFTVAGRMISERAFVELYEEIAPLAELVDGADTDGRITYFEMLTAMAFWWFAEQAVDVGVFEVGLGGRFDATNLIDADVAVLGPIDVDHAELLGDRPEDVAGEKLGIVKEGSVVVSAPQSRAVMRRVREVAAARAADLLVVGEDVEILDRSPTPDGQQLTVRVRDRVVEQLPLPLVGEHQATNAAVALAATAALTGEAFANVADELLRRGLQFASVPGRLETVSRHPRILLDGAHNPHGARAAARTLREAYDFGMLVLVVGCLGDKDLEGILSHYRDLAGHVVVAPPPSPRAAPLRRMTDVAASVWGGTGVIVETAPGVAEALDQATGLATPADLVLVTGSLFTVGAARDRYVPVPDSSDEVVYEPEDVDDPDDEAAFQEALSRMLEELGGQGR